MSNFQAYPEPANLDAMEEEELWKWSTFCRQVRPLGAARALFPERPKGYVTATKDLGNYAVNRAVAIRARLDGQIETALLYEGICDRIYQRLPEWARFW